jgi:biopolymer transport protein ExbD
MAGGSLYMSDDDADAIVDINVTPFVDVVLVLLVVFIVTAKLIVARGVDVQKPVSEFGGDQNATLRLSVTKDGDLFINNEKVASDDAAIARIREITSHTEKKAIIAGDRRTAYGGVMHAIDLLLAADVTAIALENEKPK